MKKLLLVHNPFHMTHLHEDITLKGRAKQFRLDEPLTRQTKGKMKHYGSKHYSRRKPKK